MVTEPMTDERLEEIREYLDSLPQDIDRVDLGCLTTPVWVRRASPDDLLAEVDRSWAAYNSLTDEWTELMKQNIYLRAEADRLREENEQQRERVTTLETTLATLRDEVRRAWGHENEQRGRATAFNIALATIVTTPFVLHVPGRHETPGLTDFEQALEHIEWLKSTAAAALAALEETL